MAQGALLVFDDFLDDLCGKVHNILTGGDTIKLMLINNTKVPAADDTTPVKADYTEVSGTGYTAGGETLTITGEQSSGVFTFDATGDPAASWSKNAAGPTDIYYGIIYNDSASNDECIAFIDFTSDGGTTPVSLQDGDITWTPHTGGIFTITIS